MNWDKRVIGLESHVCFAPDCNRPRLPSDGASAMLTDTVASTVTHAALAAVTTQGALGQQALSLFKTGELSDVKLVCRKDGLDNREAGPTEQVRVESKRPVFAVAAASLDEDDKKCASLMSCDDDEILNAKDQHYTAAHRFILVARSPVFRAMLSSNETRESKTGVVHVVDCSQETLQDFLEWVYSDQWPSRLNTTSIGMTSSRRSSISSAASGVGGVEAKLSAVLEVHRFKVGDRVWTIWKGGQRVYRNVQIKGVNLDGTYCAEWPDGDRGHGVLPFDIVAVDLGASVTPPQLSAGEKADRFFQQAIWESIPVDERAASFQWKPLRGPALDAALLPPSAVADGIPATAAVDATPRTAAPCSGRPAPGSWRKMTRRVETKEQECTLFAREVLLGGIINLMTLSHRYQVLRLVDMCVARSIPLIDFASVSGLLVLADRLELPLLEEACWSFLKRNRDKLEHWVTHDSYACLSKDTVSKAMVRLCSNSSSSSHKGVLLTVHKSTPDRATWTAGPTTRSGLASARSKGSAGAAAAATSGDGATGGAGLAAVPISTTTDSNRAVTEDASSSEEDDQEYHDDEKPRTRTKTKLKSKPRVEAIPDDDVDLRLHSDLSRTLHNSSVDDVD